MSTVQCPRCGSIVDSLQRLDSDTQEQLSRKSQESVPEEICILCYRQLVSGGGVSAGSALLARERAKEQRKLMLWKSRVNLIKKARMLMADRAFSEAAVAYEKYLRVLEVVFDSKPGGLTPEQFKDSARTQELTVVASVYWDLLRIYDTSEKYGERQSVAAQKLGQFLRFTPIYPDILRKAESFARTARNPGVIKTFLKTASENKGRCFVATAAFGYEEAPEVIWLRTWRERRLRPQSWGRLLIGFYERLSPPLAWMVNRMPVLRTPARALIRRIVDFLLWLENGKGSYEL